MYGYGYKYTASGSIGSNVNQEPVLSTENLLAQFDGTLVGEQLTDLSGNNRHAKISTNAVRNSLCEGNYGFEVFTSGTVERSNTQAHTGTYSWKAIQTAGATSGIKTNVFRSEAGKQYTYEFWIFIESLTGGGNLRSYCRDGNSAGILGSVIIPEVIGSWQKVTASYTEPTGGDSAILLIRLSTGAAVWYIDEVRRDSVDATDLFIEMPAVSAMATADTAQTFYDASGNAKAVRLATAWGGWNNKVLQNPVNKKILFYSVDLLGADMLAAHNYIAWNPVLAASNVKTVKKDGTGDYLTIQAALTGITDATATKRYRIDIYDDWIVTAKADYTSNASYFRYIIFKDYIYLNGVGESKIKITCSIPDDSSDEETTYYEPLHFDKITGLNNIELSAKNLRYAAHSDSSANIYLYNSKFIHLGVQGVVDYRAANSLPAGSPYDGATFGEGVSNNRQSNLYNCEFVGKYPYQTHDNINFTIGGRTRLVKCTVTAPSALDTAVLIHSIGNQPAVISQFQMHKCTVTGVIETDIDDTETYILVRED